MIRPAWTLVLTDPVEGIVRPYWRPIASWSEGAAIARRINRAAGESIAFLQPVQQLPMVSP